MPGGLPDAGSVKAARTSGHDVRTTTVSDVPVRILSDDVPSQTGTFVIQVVADRTAEQQTLDVLATVLVVGGLLAVVVATGFGAVYARRALVPIRDSLDAQRVALRRQREFAADAGGAAIAGNPYGLADALRKIDAVAKQVPLDANPATAHMFIVKPFSGAGLMSLFSTHPPTEARIAALLGTSR